MSKHGSQEREFVYSAQHRKDSTAMLIDFVELEAGEDFTELPGTSSDGQFPKMILTTAGAQKLIGFFTHEEVEACL
jgi:hypothetical protein